MAKLTKAQQHFMDTATFHRSDMYVFSLLFKKGMGVQAARDWVEENVFTLDWDEQPAFYYLLQDGGINDPEQALEQTKRIYSFTDLEAELNEFFRIPERLRGLIDYDKAYREYQQERSVFEIRGRYYIQE